MKVKKRTTAEKKFTDRTEPQKTYRQLLDTARENLDEFFVLVYYGIGGVGKSGIREGKGMYWGNPSDYFRNVTGNFEGYYEG